GAVRIVGVELIVLGIHTGRRGVENSLVVAAVGGVQDVEVDACRVVHHVGVVFAGEDVAGSAHAGCELIDFVEAAVDHLSYKVRTTQVADHEVIGSCLAETREFEISTSDPKALALEPPYKVVTNEATGSTDQRDLSRHWFRRHVVSSRV